jgi:hypothetical protein
MGNWDIYMTEHLRIIMGLKRDSLVHSIGCPIFILLTHRVSHWLTTNQMHMNMEDRLIGI